MHFTVFQVALGLLKHLGDVSSSGFSLSQFVLFLHVIPDRPDDDDEIRSLCGSDLWLLSDSLCKHKYHWIITVNGKM